MLSAALAFLIFPVYVITGPWRNGASGRSASSSTSAPLEGRTINGGVRLAIR